MGKGRLLRIILVILIIGISSFLIIRNSNLKKQLEAGEITEIKAKDFLPFGSGENGNIITNIINEILPGNNQEDSAEFTKSAKLISENTAGAIIVERDDEIAKEEGVDKNGNKIYSKITAIRYVSRENGYIYDYIPKYNKSYLISDTLLPRVSFATFSKDGNKVLMQYLDESLETEKSVLAELGSSSVAILPDNIVSFAFSNSGKFAYIVKNKSGASVFIKKDPKDEIVYSSPLSEWNLDFVNEDMILLTTKASELAPGFSYTIDLKTKKQTRIFANEYGLTTKISPDGSYILKSVTESSGPKMYIYNLKNNSEREIGKMGMTEKCSWAGDSTMFVCGVPKQFDNVLYPDAWYSGEVETNDGVIKYTTENLNEKTIGNILEDSNVSFDIWKTYMNNSGTILGFINKKDMSLWSYEE